MIRQEEIQEAIHCRHHLLYAPGQRGRSNIISKQKNNNKEERRKAFAYDDLILELFFNPGCAITLLMISKYETKKQMKLIQKTDRVILTLQILFVIVVKF